MVHDCMDSLALLSHVNSSLEQTCRNNKAFCLDNQYHAIRKNVPSDLEFLFEGNLPKRIINFMTNKKLFSTQSKPYNTSFKTSKTCIDSLKSLEIVCRMGTTGKTGQYQKPYNNSHSNSSKHQKQKRNLNMESHPGFNNFIVNELHQEVQNFQASHLRYFSKNWYKYTKDKYILDIVTRTQT